MPALRTESSALLLYDPDKSRSTVHCYSSRPTPLEERTMGRLFLVVEIEGQDAAHQQFISDLQRVVTESYYGSEQFQVEIAFERALQQTNEHLHGVIGEDLSDWLAKLHLIIAVLKETTLHFTVIGRMHAFLVHRQRIFDILESPNGAATETPSPLKIFTNIVSGQLTLDDTLLFCTTSVLDHLSQQKLKRVMSEQSAVEASRNLETLLGEAEGSSSFGAFVIRLTAEPEAAPAAEDADRERRVRLPQDSMEQLISREEATNTLLNHSLWLNLGRIAKSAGTAMRSGIGRRVGGKPGEPGAEPETAARPAAAIPPLAKPSPTATAAVGRGTVAVFKLVGMLLRVLVVTIIRGGRWIGSRIRPPRMRDSARGMPRSANRGLARGSQWAHRLTPSRRRLLLVGVVLLLVFAQSIISLGNQRDRQQKIDTYQELLRVANEKIAAADAALLIENEPGARSLLGEAQKALDQIPDEKSAPRDEVAKSRATLETKFASIRHVVAVAPEPLVDLAGLEVGFSAGSFVLDGETGYTVNENSSSVFRIDVADKSAEVIIDAPSLEQTIVGFVGGDHPPVALLMNDGSVQTIATGASPALSSAPVQFENVDRSIEDAAVYNGRLYTLDTRNNQVFRHDRSGTGYGLGQSWIKAVDLDVRNAVSLAIDGSIYLLKEDGALIVLSGGNRSDTEFEAVDPAIEKPTRLFTNGDTTRVLVLDPEQRRVVEFSKEGRFVQQFVADDFANAVDVSVTDDDAFVLLPTQVKRFSLVTP